MKALALLELVFHLPRALFGLLEAAHRVGLLPVAEVDVAQVVVGAVKVLQQLPFPLSAKRRKESRPITPRFHRTRRREDVGGALTLR